MYDPFFALILTAATALAACPTSEATGIARPLTRAPARGTVRPKRLEPTAATSPPAGELFSLRARRRFAAYLRMRLLEMREQGLERAADAVERSTPVEELLAPRR